MNLEYILSQKSKVSPSTQTNRGKIFKNRRKIRRDIIKRKIGDSGICHI